MCPDPSTVEAAEPVALLSSADPVRTFAEIARTGGWLALPTSGTSGTVRIVVRSARSWTDSFAVFGELTGSDRTSRVWIPGPLNATMNLFAAVQADWAGAIRVDSPAAATHFHLTPSRLRALLDDGVDLRGRMAVVAGDALDADLRLRAEASGARIAHYYGAAELSFVAWGADRESLGAFPRVEIDVRGGEIWARSPFLATGYLSRRDLPTPPRKLVANDGFQAPKAAVCDHFPEGEVVPEGQADVLVPGPLRFDSDGFATVGDRGCWAGDHRERLVVNGRPDAVVTGGATVLIADVEAAIRPFVRGQVAVLGLRHARLGQVVVGVLTEDADLPAARRATAGLGAGRPRRWYVLGRLPLTDAGKLDRTRLASDLAGLLGGAVRP